MKYILLLILCLVVGCTTAYGPGFITGGYKEKKLDDDRYLVSFLGNGYTHEQQVWNYWIFRCAELTIEKGYELFSLETSSKHALLNEGGLVEFTMLDYPKSRNDFHAQHAQYYSYTVTTYSSKAIVNMYKTPIPDEVHVGTLLDAQSILTQLKPYVESKAKIPPPDRSSLYIRAAVEAAIKANNLDEKEAEKLRQAEI